MGSIQNIILIFALCSEYIFFSLIHIFGIKYTGASESNMYIIFCILFAFSSLLIIFFNWGRQKFRLNSYQYIFLFLPILITILFLKENSGNAQIFRIYRIYLIFCAVASYIGIYYAKNGYGYNRSIKYWILLMWVLTIGTAIPLFLYLLTDKYAGSIDGYQTLSYAASLAYSLNLFFILYKKKIELFSFCHHPIYKIISIVLLILQVLCVFIAGGRGGFVVIAFASIMLFYYGIKLSVVNGKYVLLALIAFIVVVVTVIPMISKNEFIANGMDRVFSYISPSGIDMKKTSGRDIVFNIAISQIKERPLVGYGIFKYTLHMKPYTYPHNIVLEILLAGGVIYLLLMVLISYVFYRRMIYLVKANYSHVLLLSIFSFTFVGLMASGTYLTTPFFWFLGAYVFSFPIERKS